MKFITQNLYSCEGVFIMCKCRLSCGLLSRNISIFDFSLLFVMFSLVRQFRCCSACCLVVVRSSVFSGKLCLFKIDWEFSFFNSCNSLQADDI